jgi:predicted HNH restriction endonuclease
LTEQESFLKLKEEARSLRWKVHIKNAVRLPEPVQIPHNLYSSKNYRLVRPQEISKATFHALRQLSNEAFTAEDDELAFPEGRELFLRHRARERNPKVIKLARDRFLQKYGRFFCQACEFDFERTYGALGRGFIEAHHTVPVSELSSTSKTKVVDIALLCSNCHRMVHRKRPWLTMDKLRNIVS